MGRKHPKIVPNVPLLLIAGIALLVAACTGGQQGTYPGSAAAAPGSAVTPLFVSGTPLGTATPGTPAARQRATVDAASILASFVPPPGSRRLGGAPRMDDEALRIPGYANGSPYLVDDTSWWLAPGQPASVASYEGEHLPGQVKLAWTGSSGVASVYTFDLPPVAGVLPSRQFLLTMVAADAEHTAVRVDAQVVW